MSTYTKSYTAVAVAVLMVALTTVQAISTPGHAWTVSDTATLVLAVLGALGTHFTANSDDPGLDGRAKAVVAGVIAVLIVAVQAFQPLLGHPFTTAGLTTALIAVVGALAVYAVPEAPKTDPVLSIAPSGVAPAPAGPQDPVVQAVTTDTVTVPPVAA